MVKDDIGLFQMAFVAHIHMLAWATVGHNNDKHWLFTMDGAAKVTLTRCLHRPDCYIVVNCISNIANFIS